MDGKGRAAVGVMTNSRHSTEVEALRPRWSMDTLSTVRTTYLDRMTVSTWTSLGCSGADQPFLLLTRLCSKRDVDRFTLMSIAQCTTDSIKNAYTIVPTTRSLKACFGGDGVW